MHSSVAICDSLENSSVTSHLVSISAVFILAIYSVAPVAANVKDSLSVRLAVIEDPDGFVNVRSRPDVKSDVVLKIQKDEFFTCEPSESEWWFVKDFFDNEGYMHKSRIRLIKDLPGKDLERLFVNPPVAPDDELVGQAELAERYQGKVVEVGDLNCGDDQSLFSNSELNQCIYLTYSTDNFVTRNVLFRDNDVPNGVFDDLAWIGTKGGKLASVDAKKAAWQGLLASSTKIPARHFQTVRGLKLGDKFDKAIKIFGKPHNQRKGDDVIIYEWGFPGGYYGWEEGESSLGFFDVDCVRENGELIEKPLLDKGELEKIQQHLQSPRGDEFLNGLLEWNFPRTRGSRINVGFGFQVRLYVRDAQIVALTYMRGIP